jgi:hypothetical protein
MKRILLLTLIPALVFVTGCATLPDLGGVLGEGSLVGSGIPVTREFDLSGFDQVEVSDSFEVDIRQGDAYSVVVRTDDNVAEYLEIVQRGSTLRIGLRPHTYTMVSVETLEAEITMPELSGLELSGASSAMIVGFQSSDPFYAEVSGASSLEGEIQAGGVRFNVSGASDVKLTGSGGDLEMDVSGASSVDLAGFPVTSASIQVSGASSATVNTSGTLDVEASGASRVRYLGSPTLGSVDSSGGSTIETW